MFRKLGLQPSSDDTFVGNTGDELGSSPNAIAQNARSLLTGSREAALSLDAAFAAAAASGKSGPLQKFDSQLAAIYYAQSSDATMMDAFTNAVGANPNAISKDGQYVTIDAAAADGNGAALLAALTALGLVNGASFSAVASGLLPVAKVGDLLNLSNLLFARESFLTTDVGNVTSQGDLSMHADTARTTYNVNGTGIKIGILSDSFDTNAGASTHKAQDIASNDLPASVTILADQASGTDEGRAMAQLIHDTSPNSPILFATASGGVAVFAQHIKDLAAAGAKVIVDDANTLETWYQDSAISQAITQFVAGGGVYLTSAGNRDHWGYESAFIAGGLAAVNTLTETVHNFGTTVGGVQSTLLQITQTSDTFYEFEWADPAASVSPGHGAAYDLDLAEYSNPDGTGLIAAQTAGNLGQDPIETFTITGSRTFYLRVGKFAGPASGPLDFKIVPFPNGGSVTYGANTTNINDGTVHGHHAASGAISVAAAPFYGTPAFGTNPPTVESFSSGGPERVWFDTAGNQFSSVQLRQVPTLTAPDGGNTTFFGSDSGQDSDTFPNFFGTSAAAPEAAAVAALMLQLNPNLSALDIQHLLQDSSIDMDNPATGGFDRGYDLATGSGLIQADLALEYVKDFSPTTRFQIAETGINGFGSAAAGGGWSSENQYPRELADVNGDGKADIIGFGSAGTYVSLATSGGHFSSTFQALSGFGASPAGGGWTSEDQYPRLLADVNGDGKADIVGFGSAGTYVALATSNGNFSSTLVFTGNFGSSAAGGGWSTDDQYPRALADVNGDGKADIVGFGSAGTYVALATTNGNFSSSLVFTAGFGSSAAGGGWSSDDLYHRTAADVNGDGKADLVGFGSAGVYVALATTNGNFGPAFLAISAFGASAAAGGWTSQDQYPRELADINGDGKADIVAFGAAGVFYALGQADGHFGQVKTDLAGFGANPAAGGWTSDDLYPRLLADVTGDHLADIVGFGSAATYVSRASEFIIS